MRRTISWLGFFAGVLSLVLLLKHGINKGFVAPLQVVLDYYERAMGLVFAWAEPWIGEQLGTLGARFGLRLHLYPHWRHIFVLMWLYFGANARTNWDLGRANFAIFTAIWGGLVALAASIAAGAIPIQDQGASVLLVGFPIVGLVLFESGRGLWRATFKVPVAPTVTDMNSWSEHFNHHMLAYVMPIAVCGVAALLIGWWWRDFFGPFHSLVILSTFIVSLMLTWIGRAIWFGGSVGPRFAVLVLRVVAGAAIYIGLNAGLELAGF